MPVNGSQSKHWQFFACNKTKKKKAFFDEEREEEDEELEDEADTPNENFKTQIFDVIFERIIQEMHERYTVVMEIDQMFGVL